MNSKIDSDKQTETVKAWHFLPDNSRTRYSDEPVKVGVTLFAEGKIAPCSNGLHASEHPLDALKYAPGLLLCHVEVSGEIVRESDKLAGRTRTCMAIRDSKRMVLEFVADVFDRVFVGVGLDGDELKTVTKFVRDFAASGSMNGLIAARSAASKLHSRARARARARARSNRSKIYVWARDEFQKRVEALFS